MELNNINNIIDMMNKSDSRLRLIQEKMSKTSILDTDVNEVKLEEVLSEDEIKYVMSLYDEINKIL